MTADTRATAIVCAVVLLLTLVFVAIPRVAFCAPHPCAGATYHATVDKGTGWRVCALVHDTARKAKVSPALAVAVAQVESHFRPAAISPAGAVGPMQVKPRYHCPRGMRAFWRCRLQDTVRAGVGYLGELTARHGIDGGLARYNCGPSNYRDNAGAARRCDAYAVRVRRRWR